jgi:Ca2+-binding EF-hand superfamily protein
MGSSGSGASGAATSGADVRQFGQADRNRDGAIDKTEARQVRNMKFEEVDKDGDGKINQTEFSAWASLQRK